MNKDSKWDPNLVEPRFDECHSCKWFFSARCLSCGSGEFFEEDINDDEPDEIDLIEMAKGWYGDDGE